MSKKPKFRKLNEKDIEKHDELWAACIPLLVCKNVPNLENDYKKSFCEKCGYAIWVGAKTREMKKKHPVKIFCMECVIKAGHTDINYHLGGK